MRALLLVAMAFGCSTPNVGEECGRSGVTCSAVTDSDVKACKPN